MSAASMFDPATVMADTGLSLAPFRSLFGGGSKARLTSPQKVERNTGVSEEVGSVQGRELSTVSLYYMALRWPRRPRSIRHTPAVPGLLVCGFQLPHRTIQPIGQSLSSLI